MPATITAKAATHFGLDEAAYTFCCLIARALPGAAAQPFVGLPAGFAAPEGYTALDIPLQIGQVRYQSLAGLLPRAIPMNLGLETSGIEATLLFQEMGGLSRDLVEAGAYAGALVQVFAAPWRAMLAGQADKFDCVPLLMGQFGGAPDLTDEAATFEFVTLSQLASANVGRITGEYCDCARFGRGRCLGELADGVNIMGHGRTVSGRVIAAPAGETSFGLRLWLGLDAARAEGWADGGVLRLMGGPMAGAEFAVKHWSSSGEVLLRTPVGLVPEPGVAVELEEGCARTLVACLSKEPNPGAATGRGNVINFQGFDTPGQTKLVKQKSGKTPKSVLQTWGTN